MKRALPLTLTAVAAAMAALAVAPRMARADVGDWTDVRTFEPSPESFALELRVGSYTMENLGPEWDTIFGGDLGPLLSVEVDYLPARVPYLGLVGGGFGFGWSQYSGRVEGTATTDTTDQSQDASFEIVPMHAVLIWRFDTLAREVGVPLVLTPKVGFDFIYWGTGTGGVGEADGWSIGPRFAGQLALELDFLDPRAAQRMDDEWGVNHSELFAELWYSMAGDLSTRELPLAGWGWVAGLGITF